MPVKKLLFCKILYVADLSSVCTTSGNVFVSDGTVISYSVINLSNSTLKFPIVDINSFK